MGLTDDGEAYFKGKIHAQEGGTIAGWEVTENSIKKGGGIGEEGSFFMDASEWGIGGQVAGHYPDGYRDEPGWRIAIDDNFGVTSDGGVYARKGMIAGWDIDNKGIYKKVGDNVVVCMSSGKDLYASIVNNGGTSPIRFLAGGRTKTVSVKETITSANQIFTYSPPDCKKIENAGFTVTTGGACVFSGIETNTLTATWNGAPNGILTITYTYEPLNFIVLEDGSLYASAVDIAGTIHADSGNIGDWMIDNLSTANLELGKGIYKKGANNATAGMAMRGTSTSGDSVVFWAGCPGGTPWEVNNYEESTGFIVLESGETKCSNITITGGSLSGASITEATIGNTVISKNDSGTSIIAKSGELLIGGGESTVSFKQDAKIDTSYTIRTRAVQQSGNPDIWKFRMECVNQNGELVSSPITISHEDLYYERYINDEVSNDVGYMGISLSLSAGKTVGNWVQKQFTLNWFYSDKVVVYNDSGKGASMTLITDTAGQSEKTLDLRTGNLNNSPYYMSCNLNLYPNSCATGNGGMSLGAKNRYWYQICGYDLFYKNGYADIDASDERIKNSIEAFPEQYETFFDKMQPMRYKYNDGSSNRYHTGFIAQPLVKALDESGLTTQDFAGVVLYHPGEEDEQWYLRRDEFVALNTWQIQKLKSRVSELEKEIENLKSR